ncbi:MAG: hypothetical protein OHK0021_14420 [Bryobacter sp.]
MYGSGGSCYEDVRLFAEEKRPDPFRRKQILQLEASVTKKISGEGEQVGPTARSQKHSQTAGGDRPGKAIESLENSSGTAAE